MRLLMGIDLGSTNIKVAVFDESGNKIASDSKPNIAENLDEHNKKWLFWDHEKLWRNIQISIGKCVEDSKGIGKVSAISVTGMGMDGLPIDKNKKAIYPFISWKCKRTEEVAARWSERIGKQKIFNITGKQVMAIDTLYRILWIRENQPDVYKNIFKWLTIEDYINFKLCDEIATDYTMASCTSMYDQVNQCWSKDILQITSINEDILPNVMQSGTKLGKISEEVAKLTGLDNNVNIILGGHDYSCAAVAAGVIDDGNIFSITGTWEMFFAATKKKNISQDLFLNGFKFERHAAKNRYVIFADVVSSLMVEWFKDSFIKTDVFSDKNKWEYLIKIATNAGAGANGLVFLPHILGKGCPGIDDKSLGAFIGLSIDNDAGSMIRAIIEGLNYQFKEIVDVYEKMTNKKIEKIITVGGITKNDMWMQNKADISGKLLEVPAMSEVTALGAALFAGIGTGSYFDETEAHKAVYKKGILYEPGRDSPKYLMFYEKYFSKLYLLLKDINSDIFDEFKIKVL